LHRVDSLDGPRPGSDNFFRGGPLASYDAEARHAIGMLANRIDAKAAMRVWEEALAAEWDGTAVWVHGDMSAGNLLLRDGRLHAVIDFGSMAIGDPACDLVIAWTFFTAEARRVLRSALALDDGTWKRGRAWALWKASIVAAGIARTNAVEQSQSWRTISGILRA
jgi:aminoglycoside phosphotransferase (APT) family kinase protein